MISQKLNHSSIKSSLNQINRGSMSYEKESGIYKRRAEDDP